MKIRNLTTALAVIIALSPQPVNAISMQSFQQKGAVEVEGKVISQRKTRGPEGVLEANPKTLQGCGFYFVEALSEGRVMKGKIEELAVPISMQGCPPPQFRSETRIQMELGKADAKGNFTKEAKISDFGVVFERTKGISKEFSTSEYPSQDLEKSNGAVKAMLDNGFKIYYVDDEGKKFIEVSPDSIPEAGKQEFIGCATMMRHNFARLWAQENNQSVSCYFGTDKTENCSCQH